MYVLVCKSAIAGLKKGDIVSEYSPNWSRTGTKDLEKVSWYFLKRENRQAHLADLAGELGISLTKMKNHFEFRRVVVQR
jgi:hypothetical protein